MKIDPAGCTEQPELAAGRCANMHTIKDCRPVALVVDDEPLLRLDMADLLDDLGFAVEQAGDVATALQYLESRAEDVRFMLTDVQMPGSRDGVTLAHHVSVMWPHIRILVVSGVVTPFREALPDHVAFVAKPLSHVVLDRHVGPLPSVLHHPS